MKILFILMLICLQTTAQKKPVKKDTLPSQKEMKEMEEMLNNMSPEEKRFMDSMGIKLPSAKQIKNMGNFAMANSKTASTALVPKRDAARIAAISKIPLTKASLPAYLQTVQQKLINKFPSALVTKTETFYHSIIAKYNSTAAAANTAVGCWAFGKPAAALLLLSRACSEDPQNTDYLNNFAAMISMSGAEHLALPILNYLNKQHPQNSTLLNNIAHAWFGLGEVSIASKYIDSTLRLCAWHPQANQIKALIEESKGNHEGAVNYMKKAISRMYTTEKESKLQDYGYKLKSNDIFWGPQKTPDQLGLSKFTWPSIPKNVQESQLLEPVWQDFRKQFDERMAVLTAEKEMLVQKFQEALQRRTQQDLNAGYAGSTTSALMEGIVPKAIIKLRPYVDELLELEVKEPVHELLDSLRKKLYILEKENQKELKRINETMAPGGEGQGINPGYCAAVDNANNKFLRAANNLVEEFCIKLRNRAKKRITELVNYQYYSEFPEKFELSVNLAKTEWLSYIIMPKDLLYFRYPESLCNKTDQNKSNTLHALVNYDDINCKYKSSIDLFVGTINTECGKTVAKLDLGVFKPLVDIPLTIEVETQSADREENRNFINEFQRCTIEVSAGTGKDFGEGPLQLQTSVGATGFLEFDRTGLKDAGLKVDGNIGVGTNVLDTKVETDIGPVNVGPKEPSVSLGGVNATISINSGFTAQGSGILKGIKL